MCTELARFALSSGIVDALEGFYRFTAGMVLVRVSPLLPSTSIFYPESETNEPRQPIPVQKSQTLIRLTIMTHQTRSIVNVGNY